MVRGAAAGLLLTVLLLLLALGAAAGAVALLGAEVGARSSDHAARNLTSVNLTGATAVGSPFDHLWLPFFVAISPPLGRPCSTAPCLPCGRGVLTARCAAWGRRWRAWARWATRGSPCSAQPSDRPRPAPAPAPAPLRGTARARARARAAVRWRAPCACGARACGRTSSPAAYSAQLLTTHRPFPTAPDGCGGLGRWSTGSGGRARPGRRTCLRGSSSRASCCSTSS